MGWKNLTVSATASLFAIGWPISYLIQCQPTLASGAASASASLLAIGWPILYLIQCQRTLASGAASASASLLAIGWPISYLIQCQPTLASGAASASASLFAIGWPISYLIQCQWTLASGDASASASLFSTSVEFARSALKESISKFEPTISSAAVVFTNITTFCPLSSTTYGYWSAPITWVETIASSGMITSLTTNFPSSGTSTGVGAA